MLLLLTPPGSKERKGGKIRQLFSIKLQETRKQAADENAVRQPVAPRFNSA
jgi:hypothetical protein